MVRAPVAAAPEHPYSFLFSHDYAERRRLQAALIAAAIAHAGFLLIAWPHEAAMPVEPEARAVVQPLTEVRIRKPTPPPEPRAERPRATRRVPMPEAPPIETPTLEPIPLPVVNTPVELDLPVVSIPAPPAPPEPAPPTEVEPLRVGGAITAPVRLVFVNPRYTEIARRARIEGTVILDTVIAPDGSVQDVIVLRGLPMGLTEAAVDAVEQWRYEATTVGGRAVPVRMTLTVRFGLH